MSSLDGIDSVSVIDDDANTRDGYSLLVDDLKMQPVSQSGPFSSLEQCVAMVSSASHAAISDFKLRVGNYASFDGAELVARLYQRRMPAVLCTRFEFADIDLIRPYRAQIPCLLRPDELDVDSLSRALGICIGEFRQTFTQTRRPWRALVRVEDVRSEPGQDDLVDVCLPSWNNNLMVRLKLDELPERLRGTVRPQQRLYADVNLGAERPEELYFQNWADS